MTTLFIEPVGGMAGDMFLAALLDLEDERFGLDDLKELSAQLVPGECSLDVKEVRRGSLRARLFTVRTSETANPPHRHLSDLLGLLDRAPLGDGARERAAGCLRRIAAAEARVHGRGVEEVHFHEVGAVDTLIDVCGAALALERLGVERVHSAPPITGSGTVLCAHGEMPVPTPGTAEIMRGLPLVLAGSGERLTPTGAALLAEIVDAFEPPGAFTARAIGHGAGARDPQEPPPNFVRVQLGVRGQLDDLRPETARRVVWLMQLNLDDATGEEVGYLLGRLRAEGALEAWSEPVQMKKDRPAVVVSALAREELRAALERAAFDHSPTLGVRWTRFERSECERETIEVELEGRRVRVKVRRRPHTRELGPLDLSPEFDDLAGLATATGLPLRELERRAITAARAQLG
ncbi:MAG: nickel pincer cofactor biosynthesis protein LarC [Planctomycetota bacterium]|nr:nickel pincer cofactor biosynthesis protein LarC [Planctomycetota bacterium]